MYDTSREFIADLKSYKLFQERKACQEELLDKLHYLKYEKVKSPLDYDVIGYSGNEQLRSIKSHGAPLTTEQKWENIERIDKEIERVEGCIKRCNDKLNKIEKALDMLSDEVKGYCIQIYVKGKGYREVADENYLATSTLYRLIKKSLEIFDDFH